MPCLPEKLDALGVVPLGVRRAGEYSRVPMLAAAWPLGVTRLPTGSTVRSRFAAADLGVTIAGPVGSLGVMIVSLPVSLADSVTEDALLVSSCPIDKSSRRGVAVE